jgi:hypothetical protein
MCDTYYKPVGEIRQAAKIKSGKFYSANEQAFFCFSANCTTDRIYSLFGTS